MSMPMWSRRGRAQPGGSNDLDSTALEALGEFAQALAKDHRRLILARTHDRVRDLLTAGGLGDLAGSSTFSVADAVKLAAAAIPSPPSPPKET